MEWDATTVACEVAVGAAAVAVHTQGRTVTDVEEVEMVSVKVGWEAETSKGFSFRITVNRS